MRFLGPLLALLAFGFAGFRLYEARLQFENTPEGKAALADEAAISRGEPAPKLTRALEAARTGDRKVVLVFTATWCGTCQWLEKEILPSPLLQPQARRFLWVFLDADERVNLPTKREFGIRGYPTILVLNNQGKELERIEGPPDAKLFSRFLARY